ncbi:MAG: SUMF1/EgtB/PvdO family nonheme iron enzyme, partial [Polyangia bacterium]
TFAVCVCVAPTADAGRADGSGGATATPPDAPSATGGSSGLGGSGGRGDAGVLDVPVAQPDVPIGGSGGAPTIGGTTTAGGTTVSGGTSGSGGTSVDGGTPPPSCSGLAATCGPLGNGDCCASLLVPGGTFYRSYDDVDFTDMSYPATVNDFYLDKYEITVGRFRQFVNAGMGTQASPPASGAGANSLITGSGWDSTWNTNLAANTAALTAAISCDAAWQTWTDTAGENESQPMNCLDWYAAFAFCAWDGGRLPTEAEWNYAASGGSEQRYYPWSSPPTSTTIDDSHAVYCGGSCGGTQNVGSKSPKGDGKWGHSDLAGNVWEWTLDWYGTYQMPCDNCADITDASASSRVVRGGGFNSSASYLRSAYRYIGDGPWYDSNSLGARCARTSSTAVGDAGVPDVPATQPDAPIGGTDGGSGGMGGAGGGLTGSDASMASSDSGIGGTTLVVLASGQGYPEGIVVDSTNVYWMAAGDGTVMKVSKSGGAPTTIVSGLSADIGTFAIDATSIYWNTFNSGTVMKVPIAGGIPTTLASGQNGPAGITVDATNVYWTNWHDGTVMKVPIVGGGIPTILASGQGQPQRIMVDAVNVYWTTEGGTVMKVPIICCVTPTTLASGQGDPNGIAIDPTSVYWANYSTPGSVGSVPIGGGTPTILASGQNSPYFVAVDATSVYWVNWGDGTVMKTLISGGTPTTLSSGQQNPATSGSDIAVDDTSVYWTSASSGTVVKLTPK